MPFGFPKELVCHCVEGYFQKLISLIDNDNFHNKLALFEINPFQRKITSAEKSELTDNHYEICKKIIWIGHCNGIILLKLQALVHKGDPALILQ